MTLAELPILENRLPGPAFVLKPVERLERRSRSSCTEHKSERERQHHRFTQHDTSPLAGSILPVAASNNKRLRFDTAADQRGMSVSASPDPVLMREGVRGSPSLRDAGGLI
jgi:hypothetical protein